MKPRRRLETEVKLRIPSAKGLKQKLGAAGARKVRRLFEHNTLFDTANGKLRKTGILLRLREEFAVPGRRSVAAVLTVKGPSRAHPRLKVRSEVETNVKDPAACVQLLRAIGFRPAARYEKIRSTYCVPSFPDLHIEWDFTPIGEFLELEGSETEIEWAARRLGFTHEDYIRKSYLALYADHCRRLGIPHRDMVFQRRNIRAGGRNYA
jgi:predicted adenylyl cyclase CyaB